MSSGAIDARQDFFGNAAYAPAPILIGFDFDPPEIMALNSQIRTRILLMVESDLCPGNGLVLGIHDSPGDRHPAHEPDRVTLGDFLTVIRLPIKSRIRKTLDGAREF